MDKGSWAPRRAVMAMVVMAVLGVGGGVATTTAAADAPASVGVSLADPYIVTTPGGYVAFGTNAKIGSTLRNVPMMISGDLTSWTFSGDALPTLPAWAAPGATWSPSLRITAATSTLYFTAEDRQTGRQCIGSATASRPTGPYHAAAAPLVCQVALGGDIDPEVVAASNGTTWLLWKNDGNCCDEPVSIWSQPLAPNGALVGIPTQLLTATEPWEHGVIENPAVIEHDGVFVLTYSAGQWNSSNYGTGTAICARLDRPCLRLSQQGPSLPTVAGTAGDGGVSFFVDRHGGLRIAFHGWTAGRVGASHASRSLWTAPIGWFGDIPGLTGPAQLAVVAVAPTTTTTVPPTTIVPATTTLPTTTAPATTTDSPSTVPTTASTVTPMSTVAPASTTTVTVVRGVVLTPVRSTSSPDGSGPAAPALCVAAGAGLLAHRRAKRRRPIAA